LTAIKGRPEVDRYDPHWPAVQTDKSVCRLACCRRWQRRRRFGGVSTIIVQATRLIGLGDPAFDPALPGNHEGPL